MSFAASRRRYTFREYVRLADEANVKLEYATGEIYAMAGGTPEHAALAANVTGSLLSQLRGKPCRTHSSDLRVRVRATGLTTYPDVSVVCGTVEVDPDDENTALNPIVLVEILSPSTEDYDRGDKLDDYKQIESLREVLLVAHDRAALEVWTRDETGGWASSRALAGDRVALESIGCVLDVDEIYTDPLGTTLARPAGNRS